MYHKLLAHVLLTLGDQIEYAFDDFHHDWIYDAAKIASGENVFRNTEGIKETGKSSVHTALIMWMLLHGKKKFVRYTHSDVFMKTNVMTSVYNFFIDDFTTAVWGNLIGDAKKRSSKRQYTQSVIQLKNGSTMRGATSLQVGTGTVDLQTGSRVDLQVVDDAANLLTAESEVRSKKQYTILNELFMGCDQRSASILLFANPQGLNYLTEALEADGRFVNQQIFLYKPDGTLRWKRTDTYRGKYVETDEELLNYIQDGHASPVSVEQLKKNPTFETSFLGRRVDPSSLYIKTTQKPAKIGQKLLFSGSACMAYRVPQNGERVIIGTDHSQGQGRHNQALVALSAKRLDVLMTFKSNTIGTDQFADVGKQVFDYMQREGADVYFAPEDDRAEGRLFMRRLIEEHSLDYCILKDTNGKKGYQPNEVSNRKIYTRLQEGIDMIKVRCPSIFKELDTFTWDAYTKNLDTAFGHYDMIRALAIAYEFASRQVPAAYITVL